MNNIKKFKATIFGESYVLVSDESDKHLSMIEDLVNKKMQDIAKKMNISDVKKLAVLAALQVCSELIDYKQDIYDYNQKSKQLLDMLSSELLA